MPNLEPDPPTPPQVQDKRVRPSGVLPRNTQALVLCGLASVMIIVIALSGRNAPKEKAVSPPVAATETRRGPHPGIRSASQGGGAETRNGEVAARSHAAGFGTGSDCAAGADDRAALGRPGTAPRGRFVSDG